MSSLRQALRTSDGRVVHVEASASGDVVTVRIDEGEPVTVPVRRSAAGGMRMDLPGGPQTVHASVSSRWVEVSLGGRSVLLQRVEEAAAGGADEADADVARAPMPGKVVEVAVAVGAAVEKGEALLVLEAMKLNNAVKAPRDGVVAVIEVVVGDQVGVGDPLVRLAVAGVA